MASEAQTPKSDPLPDGPIHWCDSIEVELIGTDSYHHRSYEPSKTTSLQDLRIQGEECKFCAQLAGFLDYRFRLDSTWAKNYGLYTAESPTKPTEEEISNAQLSFTINGTQEVRNWSFGWEGVAYRTVMNVYAHVGKGQTEIVLQRAGPGGLVPVTNKSETEYGDNTITYDPAESWRVKQPGDSGPLGWLWEKRPQRIVGSLEPAFGRPRPLLIDFDTLAAWIRICDQKHDVCQHRGSSTSIPRLRLVDIENMCVTEVVGQERPQFATLSYVWGTTPFLRLTTDNIANLQKPGSLRDTSPPLTISDAITVCARLQIKYLWVDSLCIIQDDETDMLETIDKMDSIYGESVLTIVAASGVDAHSGIPGVHPGTRFLEQHHFEKRGVQLIDSVDKYQFRPQTRFQEPEWISRTPWARRAWTFQEAIVSRRVLFFTSEQVYWSCREGLLSEDTTEHFESNLMDNGDRQDAGFEPLEYQHIAIAFSTRRLTFEADMGRAYLGTQNYLDKKWGGHKFSWGLPHGAFGSFLMWQWQFHKSRRMREGMHPIRQADGSIVKVPFPSWSWMGWLEGGQLIDFYGDEPSPHSPSFFVFNSATDLVAVCDGAHWRSEPEPLADLLVTLDDNETNSELETEVTEKDIPLDLIPSIRHSALMFYTETVKVRYDPSAGFKARSMLDPPSDLQMTSQKYPFSIMVGDRFYRILEEHQTDSSENEGLEEIELVAVFAGQMTKPKKLRGQYRLYCWPVKRQGEIRVRTSYMNTIIFLSLWNILPRRKWELVTMI
ncbi:hypothetical protein G7Z17_g12456 [Cylindrodendrum hubeiense]|uniref:Heterokaryon incompatibility domain-containing protein n=1 Tax=Cylindrodendrum hubeiense TaxID=595255 RepID=A0A9P5L985_9HYPO|nr:hypothetical protein G7Z17_g12456 [Cylindrodendrum hubeiense]